MKFKHIAKFTLALILIALVALPVAAQDGEKKVVTWSVWGSPEELAAHEAVAEAFMEAHEDFEIVVMHTPWDGYHDQLKVLAAAEEYDKMADVIFVASDSGYYVENGIFEPLDEYIEATGYDLDAYFDAVNHYWPDGKVYGLQRDFDLHLLYYNKDMFDAAELEFPAADWTWEDWAEAAEALTIIEDNGRVVQQGIGMETGKFRILISQAGGGYVDDPVNPSTCTLNDEEARAAIDFYHGLIESGVAMLPGELDQAGGDRGAFISGRVAMIVQNLSRAASFDEAGMNFDIAPVPLIEGGERVNNSGGAPFFMNAHSDNKEDAWTFLSWLQGEEGQRIYTEMGQMFPVIISVAETTFVEMEGAPENREAAVIEARNAGFPTFGNYPEYDEMMDTLVNPQLQLLWIGEGTPDEIVPQICEDVNTFLEQNGYPKEDAE